MARRKQRQKRDGHSSEWGKGKSANKADVNPPPLLHGIPSGSGGGASIVHMSLTAMSWRQKRKAFPPLSSAFCFFQHFTQETENRDATVGFPSFSRSRKVPQLFEKKKAKEPKREADDRSARAGSRWMDGSQPLHREHMRLHKLLANEILAQKLASLYLSACTVLVVGKRPIQDQQKRSDCGPPSIHPAARQNSTICARSLFSLSLGLSSLSLPFCWSWKLCVCACMCVGSFTAGLPPPTRVHRPHHIANS
jgi:hypothetical protein